MAGASALLRSAEARRNRLRAQEDNFRAFEWDMSAKTWDDYQRYYDYLKDRQSAASDAEDSLAYVRKMQSAHRGYTSNEIQRQSQNVLMGRSSNMDKMGALESLYLQARSMGNEDAAQTLFGQMLQLDKTIQSEQIAAAESAIRINEANAKAQAGGYKTAANLLKNGLEDLTAAFNRGGQMAYNEAAARFIDSKDVKSVLEQLGIDLPKGASTNVGQVVTGVMTAIGEYYTLAADAVRMTDPEAAADYDSKAYDIASGATKFRSPAGEVTLDQARKLAEDPYSYVETINKEGKKVLTESTKKDWFVNNEGKLVSVPTGSTQKIAVDTKKAKKELESLGFTVVGDSVQDDSGMIKVKLTSPEAGKKGTKDWLDFKKLGLTENTEFYVLPTSTGYEYADTGNGKLYNFAIDEKGLGGVYEITGPESKRHISGQYGFNQGINTLTKNNSLFYDRGQADLFRKAGQQAELVLGASPRRASRIVSDLEAQAGSYLNKQGVSSVYSPTASQSWKAEHAAMPADNRALGAKISLQPWYESRGVIGGKAYNYAGEYIPYYEQRQGGGFNLRDASGRPISALTYAKQTKQSFRKVLEYFGSKGDTYAAKAAAYATDSGITGNYSPLTWGN